jgi:hypothetical protein
MDDEIALDENNNYIILYSIDKDQRPNNAKSECGVTWQELGPERTQGFPIRWMSVYPNHHMGDAGSNYAPDDDNIPWSTGGWSEDSYNKDLVGKNSKGVMGDYHPIIHRLTKSQFEALGCPEGGIKSVNLPIWN